MDVEAWAEQAAESLSAISISAPQTLRGTTASIAIALDQQNAPKDRGTAGPEFNNDQNAPSSRVRREPLRRDSLKRRDALLKGKEGTRQRRRWENGR